ncbi:MAG: hypothetical protein ACRD59_06195 [Candidatus Acidiferrales bacterium]
MNGDLNRFSRFVSRHRANFFLALILAVSVVTIGCASARMYPVEGPMASQTPGAVYTAKLTGLLYSGDVTITVANGEVCKGHWTLVKGGTSVDAAPARVTPARATTADGTTGDAAAGPSPVTEGMPAAWDAVYGQGYYVARVLGQPLYAHAMVVGNRGTVLNVEFYRVNRGTDGPIEIHGVAKDNKGDIFKLSF